jgi:hypothetical protein
VWNKRWVIVLPSIALWIGVIPCSILPIWTGFSLGPLVELKVIWTFYLDAILTLTLNMVTTCERSFLLCFFSILSLRIALTVWKIWTAERQAAAIQTDSSPSSTGSSRLRRIMHILIESAALYSISLVSFIIASAMNYQAAEWTATLVRSTSTPFKDFYKFISFLGTASHVRQL